MSVDIFKGFPDEESIVNYTLNQAYQDNVTVFASEPAPWAGPQPGSPASPLPETFPSRSPFTVSHPPRPHPRPHPAPPNPSAPPPPLGPAHLPSLRPAPSPVPGVIFQTRKDGSLPPHVHYKIRQNSSFTEKTNEIRRAYWRPGPNTGGRFYFLYGFVWIQGLPI